MNKRIFQHLLVTFVTQLLSFGGAIILARFLGVDERGRLGISVFQLTLVLSLSCFGFNEYVSTELNNRKRDFDYVKIIKTRMFYPLFTQFLRLQLFFSIFIRHYHLLLFGLKVTRSTLILFGY